MKNDELNLDILANADNDTVKSLSESYKAVSDSDISRLYSRSERIYQNRKNKDGDYSMSVSGIELYHKPVWKKAVSIAASLVIAATAVTGGLLLLKNRIPSINGGSKMVATYTLDSYTAGSTEEIPYETIIEKPEFMECYKQFTSSENPLALSGGPYMDAVVAKPFKSVFVKGDNVVAPINIWMFPVVSGNKFIGFIKCDMRCIDSSEPVFSCEEGFASKVTESVQHGDILIFTTNQGTYSINEDTTYCILDADDYYMGNVKAEQADQGYNMITKDSLSDIVYGPMTKEWGITLKAANVKPGGLTIECTQSGGKNVAELSTGSYFNLQKRNEDEWLDVDFLPQEGEVAWTSESWLIQKEGTVSWDVDWKWLYGELTKGEYRIGKKIMNFREPGDYDEQLVYVEFTVSEYSSHNNNEETGFKPEDAFENMVCSADEAMEWALDKPVAVISDVKCVSGKDTWNEFLTSVNAKKPASVLLANYYELDRNSVSAELYEAEKDDYPQLFFSLIVYDGESFRLKARKSDEIKLDSDATYKYLVHLTGENNKGALYRYTDEYDLVDDPDVTLDDINQSMFSSQMSDWINHSTVYMEMYD